MSEHTPTPWSAAAAYSSICGVPIVSQKGGRVGNTALPDMPREWGELKRRAVADAAFICKAANSHEALVAFAEFIRDGYDRTDINHVDFRVGAYKAALDVLGVVGTGSKT